MDSAAPEARRDSRNRMTDTPCFPTAAAFPPLSRRFAPFECIAIVGVGLMGGSLGMALRARGLARRVIGVDSSAETRSRAQERGAIDAGTDTLAGAVRSADGVVVAAPVGLIPSLLEAMAPHVRPDALVTDLGSTKAVIVQAGTRLFGPRFVGGHPMAGSEQSGIEAARADLFDGAAWAVVRPEPFAPLEDAPAVRLAALAFALGARPIPMDAARHDRLVALVSHLPHLLSFAFAHTVGAAPDAAQAREMAGGSYRDLMRVSAADPALWRDIFLDNRASLLAALDAFDSRLAALRRAVEAANTATLDSLLETRDQP
jgi:prephenate dehydrogenase